MAVLRRLEGITYWVLENPDEIYDFINTNIRKEWEADLKREGRNPGMDPWLRSLPQCKWRLEVVNADRIQLSPEVMNLARPEKGYSFQASLERRSRELRTVMETFGVVIWPLIVRKEDMSLVDGYCRITVLRKKGVSQVYAYIGTM